MFKCLLSTFLMWNATHSQTFPFGTGRWVHCQHGWPRGISKLYFNSYGKDCTHMSNCYSLLIFHKQPNIKSWTGEILQRKRSSSNSFSKIRIQSLHSHCYHIYYFIIWPWIQVHLVTGSLYRIFGIQIPNSSYFFLKLEEVNEASKLSAPPRHLSTPQKWDFQHIGLASTFSDRFSPISTN